MNPSTRTPSATTRFAISRAQFSPLARRTASITPARTGTSSVRLVTKATARVLPDATITAGYHSVPNFWSSGELDRLQPEVTRYHD